MDIFGVLQLVGGLCLFLFGMETMGDGLTKASGSKLEGILKQLTSNVPKGVLLGCAVTAIIQSSSATTVMLVGFVNSGIMQLRQVIPVIMGANIGTTATAWILSLSGISGDSFFVKMLKPMSFSPIVAVVAVVFIMFSKNSRKKDIGMVLIGFVLVMYGMNIMSGAVEPLKDVPEFTSILTMFSNPILGVAAGAILTAAIQSSSASVGILQVLSQTGAVTYGATIPIIMGQNIGTCITAILSAIGANKSAKRVAAVHLSFNIIGTVFFLVIFYTLNAFVHFSFLEKTLNPADIAIIHSAFNIACTCILLPFCKQLEKLATVLVKDQPDKKLKDSTLTLLEERFIDTPAVAVIQCNRVAFKMAELSRNCILAAMGLIREYERDKEDYVYLLEEKIDRYEDALGGYVVKLSARDLADGDSQTLSSILHNIGDLERISDHARNIAETANELYSKKLKFSSEATKEIEIYMSAVEEIVNLAIDGFVNNDVHMAGDVEPLEEVIDAIHSEVKNRHVDRLKAGICTIEQGFVLADLGTNLERVADHCSNIAVCTIETQKNQFDMHHYIHDIKKYDTDNFEEKEKKYEAKYSLTNC